MWVVQVGEFEGVIGGGLECCVGVYLVEGQYFVLLWLLLCYCLFFLICQVLIRGLGEEEEEEEEQEEEWDFGDGGGGLGICVFGVNILIVVFCYFFVLQIGLCLIGFKQCFQVYFQFEIEFSIFYFYLMVFYGKYEDGFQDFVVGVVCGVFGVCCV